MRKIVFLFLVSSIQVTLRAQQDSIATRDSLSILAEELTREYNASKVNFSMSKADTPSFHLNLSPKSDNPFIFNQTNVNNAPYNNTRIDPANPWNAQDPVGAFVPGVVNYLVSGKKK